MAAILRLPDELLELIVSFLAPDATVAFGATCRRTNKITYEPLVWRRHCLQTWRFWNDSHEIRERSELPPVQTKWRQLYMQRQKTDQDALDKFNGLLMTQQHRFQEMETIASFGYDVKDVLLELKNNTPDSADDVLARRYHAKALLGQIHRTTALGKWQRLQQQQMIGLEEALGAYDLFVLSGDHGDLDDLCQEFDRIADAIKKRDPEFEELSTRRKAIQIARYLRSENLVGNVDELDYHALRNNFMSLALFDSPRSSLPLQSVAIYCAVARRLGIDAKPANYPQHVHAVVRPPKGANLDGNSVAVDAESEPEQMHMDPWRSSDEMSASLLRQRLSQMGLPANVHNYHLAPTSIFEAVLRAGRNIMTSVQEARDRQRFTSAIPSYPDVETAWYAMLWAMLVLGDPASATVALQRRRQCLPYFIDQFHRHFPEDLGLVESLLPPMFQGEGEHDIIVQIVQTAREKDRTRRAPSLRLPGTFSVPFKVGTSFKHKRYGYEGIIIGWDATCSAEQDWIRQMRVDDLPRGRNQPFYNVVANDKSVRYVAEENIVAQCFQPSEIIMQLAGRYFKRWDNQAGFFVSNIKEEYPDD